MGNSRGHSTLGSVILWSVISAAFIGPGTITTAVTAGSLYQTQLIWAIAFSTLACLMLQEVSARIAIASGLSFGQALVQKFGIRTGRIFKLLVGGSVVLGCAAYEAGNILGAVAGLALIFGGSAQVYTLAIVTAASVILWTGKRKFITTLMTVLVGVMGLAFIGLALNSDISWLAVVKHLVPSAPPKSDFIVIALIGTTIVPYNLFLSSGISRGQTVPLMRVGLTVSVLVGGFITASILLVGTIVPNFSSFGQLANVFQSEMGSWSASLLGAGLFAAGFSSTITAPFAASIIGSQVFGLEKESHIRMFWVIVILTGFFFGISGIKPIPVILGVQALNGLILPLIVAFLILVINDRSIIPHKFTHKRYYDGLLLLVFGIVLFMSLNNLERAVNSAFSFYFHSNALLLSATIVLVAMAAFLLAKRRE